MQRLFRKIAVAVAVAVAVVSAVLRIVLTPQMQISGGFRWSYWIITLMIAAFAAVTVLVVLEKGRLPLAQELVPAASLPLAISSLLAGGILAASSLYDGCMWWIFQKTPPPNDQVISSLDAGALFLTLVFGILGGAFLVWLGVVLAEGRAFRTSRMALAALAPVAWGWFRLVRYELSYASAVQVSQSFYDFVMLIFTLLFLFAFARYISGTGERKPPEKRHRLLLIYALCTAVMSLSGPLTNLALYITGTITADNFSWLAGIQDFGIGAFALCTALTLVFGNPVREIPEVDGAPEDILSGEAPLPLEEETKTEEPPTAEEVLREMYPEEKDW